MSLTVHKPVNWPGPILAVLSALALLPHAQGLEQNATTILSCECNEQEYSENNINLYNCPGDVTVTINDIDGEARIDCYGNLIDCSKLKLSHKCNFEGTLLQNLIIKNCSVDSSLECVLASMNATGASRLTFENVLTPVTEETVRGLDMITEFYVTDGVQDTIPVEVLKRLPIIMEYRLYSAGIRNIPSNTFNQSGLPELTYLVISQNNINTLQADAFNGLKKLETLFLDNNSIPDIDLNAFRGLDSLKELYLDSNNISVLPSGLFLSTPLLRHLTLPRNTRELRVQTGAMSGLAHLEKLDMSHCGGLKLEPAALSNLPSLKTLKLMSSGITELPADLFVNTTAVVDLVLSNNKLRSVPESVFSNFGKLQKLNLSNNMLEEINCTLKSLVELQELYMDDNLIETLPEELFSAKNLKVVSISHNRIKSIHSKAFVNVNSVTRLDLSFNQLTFDSYYPDVTIDNSSMTIPMKSPLHFLKNMKHLNLSHNNISNICVDWVKDMTQLQDLKLSFNDLTKISSVDLNFVSRNIKVDLRDNHITTLKLPVSSNKPTLLLGRNPYNCDCLLFQFLNELKNLPYDVSDATCHLPPSLRGAALGAVARAATPRSALSLANLTCALPAPAGCACVARPAERSTECDCQHIHNNTLPIPTHSGPTFSEMVLTLHTVDHLHFIPEFVKKLILSSIGLRTVPDDIPENVKFVDLRNNRLSRVPLEFLRRNITLKVGGNPLKCDCWGTEDVKNLQKYRDNINDYDSLGCTDGAKVRQVNAERLCDEIRATVIGASLAVFGLIVAITGALAYRYSLYIKVYLYNKGWTWLVKEEMLDASKLYDIFISYHHADETFVKHTLLPKLDKDYKVCIHSRDFRVGGRIPDQIYLFVAQSRRTLIVISNEFLSDPKSWVIQEFEAVVMQTKTDQRPRAVVVVKGDVSFDNAPDIIKNHVKMNTYIKWGDAMFWKRLRYALPKKLRAEDLMLQESTRQAVQRLGNGKSVGALNGVLNESGKLENVPALKGDDPSTVTVL